MVKRISLHTTMVVLAVAAIVPASILAQAQIVPGGLFGRGSVGDTDQQSFEAVLPHDRDSVRRLKQIDELITEKRYGDAIVLLDRLLSADEDSFFHTDNDRTQFRSMKSEALRQVSALPADGMATYRLQFGARARKLLEKASTSGEIAKLEEVSRRYFHTAAGYEASLLLGQHHLDNGRPLQAAICFQQVLDTPGAATSHGPALSVLAANCWLRAGQEDRARQTIAAMRQNYSHAKTEIGGRTVELAGGAEDELEWLERVVGESSDGHRAIDDQWLMVGGGPARNAESRGDRPLLSPRWRQRTVNDPAVEKLVRQIQDSYIAQNVPAMPSLQALAIGDVVLMRSASNIVAVDFETGRRVWEARPAAGDSVTQLLKTKQSNNGDWKVRAGEALEQRLWNDAVFGTLSSDGERAFVIRDSGWPMATPIRTMAIGAGVQIQLRGPFFGQRAGIMGLRRSNRLAALDLKTEGKLVWELGGPNQKDPNLDGAYFLGAPLAITGRLYCLAEIKSGIRLLVLDAKTGHLEWSQQLADVERDIAQNPLRRQAAASPSYADGVLICPTSAGAVVAVDLTRRSFLWAYRYPYRTSLHQQRLRMHPSNSGQATAGEHWVESHAIIADGRVLVTPIESKQIYCLNMLDGTLEWQMKRDESLYVGCVYGGNVFLVGRNDITAVEIASGKIVWEKGDCPLPEGSVPSGRGFYAASHYYLPLSTKEVAKIDLDKGKVVARSRSRDGLVPGNLICHRGSVVSLSADSLDAFYQVEPLRARVTQALAKNPMDSEALVRRGELALDEDDLPTAIESFRASYRLTPDESTHELFVRALLRALQQDFAAYRGLTEELDSLIEDPERRGTFYRLVGRGQQAEGNRRKALATYLKLIDLRPDGSEMVDEEPGRKVRLDRWIASQLVTLHDDILRDASLKNGAPSDDGREFDAVMTRRRATLGDDATGADLRRFVTYFGELVPCDDLRVRLASMLLTDGDLLRCERVVRRLETSSSVEAQRASTALMARLLGQAGRHDQAAPYFQRLRGEFSDQICLDGETGAEIMASVPGQDRANSVTGPSSSWPVGEVIVKKMARRANQPLPQFMVPLQLRGTRQPFFEDTTVHVETNVRGRGSLAIVGYDAVGTEQFRTPIAQDNSFRGVVRITPQRNISRGVVDGHLLVCSLGARLVAIDALAPGTDHDHLLWQCDLQSTVLAPHRSAQTRFRGVQGGEDKPIGSLGPLYAYGLIIQRGHEVACLDPLSGEDIWVLADIEPGCTLFGDDELLFIVPPSDGEGDSVASVVHPRDGRRLGTRTLPHARERLATYGSYLLKLSTVSDKVELKLIDPWAEQDVWSQSFDADSAACLVDHELVAVVQRSGSFRLMNIRDGSALIDTQLEPDARLASIRVDRFNDQYLLMAGSPPLFSSKADSVKPLDGSKEIFTGHIYAFDRNTGRSMWENPVFLYRRGLVTSQARDLPVLTFAESHTKQRKPGRSSRSVSVSVLCLDRRTGRPVFEKDGLSQNDSVVRANGDPHDNTVTLSLRTTNYQLKFTEKPLPPEPSFEDDRERRPKSNKKGSIFNLLGSAD